MENYFIGKRALVTGAAGGIGSAVVEKLINVGATVIALDVSASGLEDLKIKFPKVDILCVDLLNWYATRNAAKQHPDIDLLVNCAGVVDTLGAEPIDEMVFDRVFGINTKAVLNLSQAISENMKAGKRGGAIVNISSQVSKKACPETIIYSASKAALDMITKCMALELAPHKIRVNAVHPTVVNTRLIQESKLKSPQLVEKIVSTIPVGRIAEPGEIADTVLFLLSDKAQMITGVLLSIDGGATL